MVIKERVRTMKTRMVLAVVVIAVVLLLALVQFGPPVFFGK